MNDNITTKSVHVSNIYIVMSQQYLFCSLLMLTILLQGIPWLSPDVLLTLDYNIMNQFHFFADKGYILQDTAGQRFHQVTVK
jgi:hypothetical protein